MARRCVIKMSAYWRDDIASSLLARDIYVLPIRGGIAHNIVVIYIFASIAGVQWRSERRWRESRLVMSKRRFWRKLCAVAYAVGTRPMGWRDVVEMKLRASSSRSGTLA